jgi:hypothetical protein
MENKTLKERFWSKVEKTSGCWNWTASKANYGYGSIWDGERLQRAHRLSWSWVNGPIPEGMWVLHHCDNTACVRPDHLYLGKPKDNTKDMFDRGRAKPVHGETHPLTSLTEQQVIEIRRRYRDGENPKDFADDFGMKWESIYRIARGDTWKHVPGAVKRGKARGINHCWSKLTDDRVREAHKRAANGETLADIAREFGCSGVGLGAAVNGKTWKHLNLPPLNLKSAKGSRQRNAKLTEDQVRGIRELHAKGVKGVTIAKIYSISTSVVSVIASGKRWSHVT